jgi:hypothetical protein
VLAGRHFLLGLPLDDAREFVPNMMKMIENHRRLRLHPLYYIVQQWIALVKF